MPLHSQGFSYFHGSRMNRSYEDQAFDFYCAFHRNSFSFLQKEF
jgi:hypothetical protein